MTSAVDLTWKSHSEIRERQETSLGSQSDDFVLNRLPSSFRAVLAAAGAV